jgi:hypothetical protein
MTLKLYQIKEQKTNFSNEVGFVRKATWLKQENRLKHKVISAKYCYVHSDIVLVMHQVTPVFVPHSTYFLPTLKKKLNYDISDGFVFMVFNATFNNIKAILWRSVLLVEETRVPRENHRPVASHWQTLLHNVVSSTPHHERGLNSQLYWW